MQSQNPEPNHLEVEAISVWSRSGLPLLLGAFAIFLFKNASAYWPVIAAAFLGYAAIKLGKKAGFYLSLAVLCGSAIFVVKMGNTLSWTLLLSACIALSWVLIYLGGLDLESRENSIKERIFSIEEARKQLEQQLRDKSASLTEEQRNRALDKQHFAAQIAASASELSDLKQAMALLERERNELISQCSALSQDHLAMVLKQERTVEEARIQLAQLQAQCDAFLQESRSQQLAMQEVPEETLQFQFALLREQFEEKSQILDQTRKDLFKVENDYLALQKAFEENTLEPSEEILAVLHDLKALEKECTQKEEIIASLQDFVSMLLSPKKRSSRPSKKSKEQGLLPELIQTKIDQNTLFSEHS